MDRSPITTTSVGLLRDTLVPSISLHSGLSIIAYTAARTTSRVELKDWLWPSGQVLNAWWAALGRPTRFDPELLLAAFQRLPWDEQLLLFEVTAWGLRLFYRIASRSISRGKDDPRYEELKKQPGFWNKEFFAEFLPEAVFQTLITIPFTAVFRDIGPVAPPEYAGVIHGAAVGIFAAGFAMETLADVQIERHKKENRRGLVRQGVWSVVRHPNYLGDALVHFSFPLLMYASGKFHPLILLGPVANYVFLRGIGGDKQNEDYQEKKYKKEDPEKHAQFQEWRRMQNSFWPGPEQLSNPWTWALVTVGGAVVVVERMLRQRIG